MKRQLIFLLTTIISLTPFFAQGKQIMFEVDGINYGYIDREGTYDPYWGKIFGVIEGEYSGDITIPSSVSYNGKTYPITGIDTEAFEYCTELTSINFPNTLIYIGSRAFKGCIGLTSVTLPNPSITLLMKSDVFQDCSGLTTVIFPSGVVDLQDNIFKGCDNLSTIKIQNPCQGYSRWANKLPSNAEIEIPQDAIGAFLGEWRVSQKYELKEGSQSLTNLKVNGELLSIQRLNLDDFSYTLVNGRNIHEAIIKGYSNGGRTLANLKIPSKIIDPDDPNKTPYIVKSISEDAFAHKNFTSVSIPNTVTLIGPGAFKYCKNLTSISIPNSVKYIGGNAFGDSGLTALTLPPSVISIGSGAFQCCYQLKTITIPSSVKFIDDGAFYDCTSLRSISLPSSISVIYQDTFRKCKNLTSVTIPSSVKYIGTSAFSSCNKLMTIAIPSSVKFIGNSAFSSCDNLTTITIPRSVKEIGRDVFSFCKKLKTVRISKSANSEIKNSLTKEIEDLNERNVNKTRIVYL